MKHENRGKWGNKTKDVAQKKKKINKVQKIADRANLIAMICCIVQELNKRG